MAYQETTANSYGSRLGGPINRPLVSIILLVVVVGCIVLIIKTVKGKKPQKAQETATETEKPNA